MVESTKGEVIEHALDAKVVEHTSNRVIEWVNSYLTKWGCGQELADNIDEDDIESLLIQQLEFCNTVLLNKVDTVDEYQLGELKAIVKSLQTKAVIIEANYAKVKIADVLNTGRFDLESSMESAGWIEAIQNADIEDHDHDDDDDDDEDEHEHHHHHDDDDDDDEHEHHHHDDDDDDDDHHEEHHGHGHHHHHHHENLIIAFCIVL